MSKTHHTRGRNANWMSDVFEQPSPPFSSFVPLFRVMVIPFLMHNTISHCAYNIVRYYSLNIIISHDNLLTTLFAAILVLD